MKFFSTSHWALLGSDNKGQKVDVTYENGEVQLRSPSGKFIQKFLLNEITWLPCAVAGKKDHCLALQLLAERREVLLRAPSRASVDRLVAQLEAAAACAQQEAQQATCSHPAPLASPSVQAAAQGTSTSSPDGGSISFGSPVSREEQQQLQERQVLDEGRQARQQPAASGTRSETTAPQADDDDNDSGVCVPSAPPTESRAGTVCWKNQQMGQAHGSTTAAWPEHVLISAARPGGAVKTHVQKLEEAVARLEHEAALGAASRAGTPRASAGARAPICCGSSSVVLAGGVQAAPMDSSPQASPAGRAVRRQVLPPRDGAALELVPATSSPGAAPSLPVDALVRENELLHGQLAVVEAEACRLRAEVQVAAGDNVRLAQEAAAVVHQLQDEAAAAAGARAREQVVREELGRAVARCQAAADELRALGSKAENRGAQCAELRRALDEASKEKALLTAALTATQLQLRDATPQAHAAQVAELAAARKQVAEQEDVLADLKAREAQATAQAAAAAARAEEAEGRERVLKEELREARAQLAGGLPPDHPARSALERADALATANSALQQDRASLVAQVGQLRSVGEELSRSCTSLEQSLAASQREREGLQAALLAAQQAAAGAQQAWGAERAGLQGRLGDAEGGRAAAAALSSQVEALQQQLLETRRCTSVREQELHSELKLQAVKAEAEVRAVKDRAEAAAAMHSAELARLQQALHGREAAAAAAAQEAAAATSQLARLQEEARRAADQHAAAGRALQLDLSSQKAEESRLVQAAEQARMEAVVAKQGAEDAAKLARQAEAQLATVSASLAAANQERKGLQAKLEQTVVQASRAAREAEALRHKYSALKQQAKLLEAVAQQAGARHRGSGRPGGFYDLAEWAGGLPHGGGLFA